MNSRFNWDNLSSFLKDKWSLHQSQCFRSLDLKKDGWGMGLNYYTKGITNEVAIRIFEYLELILCKEVKALQYCDVRSPTEMMLMFEWRRAIENHSLKSGFHVAQQVPRYYYDHLKQRARIRKIDFLFSYSSTKYLIPIQLAVECDSSYHKFTAELDAQKDKELYKRDNVLTKRFSFDMINTRTKECIQEILDYFNQQLSLRQKEN